MDDATFRAIQDDAIRDVVKLQAECGLDVVNDGEFRRGSYWGRFVELTDGLTVKKAIFKFKDDHGHELEFTAPHVNGKVRRGRPIATDEVAFLRALTDKPIKVTLPVALDHAFLARQRIRRSGPVRRRPKPSSPTWRKVFQDEIAELAAAGAQYVQLDEVAIAMLCDPAAREKVEGGRARSRPAGRPLRRRDQRGGGEAPGEHGRRRAHVPRQLQGQVSRRGRLRLGRRASCSTAPTSTTSCSSTTRRAPATSRRCGSCRRTRAWCWAW